MLVTEMMYRKHIKANKGRKLFTDFPELLSRLWQDDYSRTFKRAEFLEVTTDAGGAAFTYLFDYDASRTVGVWGMPIYSRHVRDSARMAGAPLGAKKDSGYHRGHLIAHSIGGGMDINLVPQLGKINIGAYRVLERQARDLAQEGVNCFYFVRTLYSDSKSQMPSQIEQVLAHQDGSMSYELHSN